MKKTVIKAMTLCWLFCFSFQQPAPAEKMAVPASRTFEIVISVMDGHINMGEKYAYAVPPESTIKWKCKYKFNLQFDSDAPFEVVPQTDMTIAKKVKSTAIPNHLYKYTVAVSTPDAVLLLDPIIVIIPPTGGHSK
jgi:hypothetical protein